MKTSIHPKPYLPKISALTLAALSVLPALNTHAADYLWSGGTGTYNNAAAWGGTIPSTNDVAINNTGTNNVVQINSGNPDWTLSQIAAGSGANGGSFEQNGQTVTLGATIRALRLGVVAGQTGAFTLNNGTLNYGTGEFAVGELGTGVLTVNGGVINGAGTFAVNRGTSFGAVTASMDGGLTKAGYTWFERGYYTTDPTIGLPVAGSTFTNVALDHAYTMAASYTANNSFLINSNLTSTTITVTAPTACSALSFLGSAGHGPMTVNYTIHFADTTTESGSINVLDWFPPGGSPIALEVRGRVLADGSGIQIPGGNFPSLLALDVAVVNTASAITSVDLSYTSGAADACILALSGSTGGMFLPLAISGYNQDMVVEAGTVSVSPSVTDVMNQTGGTINTSGEFWVGNVGTGILNLSGGAINSTNWFVVGRLGGNGTMNMTGGSVLKVSGGQPALIVGDNATGTLNHSGGSIATTAAEYWVGNGGASLGTNNMSGTATLSVGNWIAIGRAGLGVLNLSGNAVVTKSGGGNIVIPGSGTGIINQSGGTFNVTGGQVWLPENGNGTWNLTGGAITAGVFQICRNGGSVGVLNLDGGTLTVGELTTGNVGGFSTLNLNGGTIIPTANNQNFLHDLTLAQVGPGGAIFNTAGFDVVVPQTLTDNAGGGLTKTGAGTLTLSGGNSYGGNTTINAGKLLVSSAATTAGDVTVANNAGFGVTLASANGQYNAANFTLSGPTAASLDFNLGAFGNPVAAPVNVIGNFDVNGTVTVNVTDDLPQIGQFPLVAYGTRTGSGNFVLGTLPVGLAANLVTNGNTIALNITSVNLPRWDGASGNNWDIGLTTPWINIGTGLPTTYGQGNFVLFDDNATGNTTVNLTTTVNPGSVTVNNTNLPYAVVGSGRISGSIGILKQGPGTLSLLNTGGNNYTGATVISNGVLSVTNLANGGVASPIGAASASPTNLVLVNGALSYAGAPVTANRGFTMMGTNSTIDAQTDFALSGAVVPVNSRLIKTGPARFTYSNTGSNLLSANIQPGLHTVQGTMVFDGSGTQTNRVQNEMWVGGSQTSGAAMVLTNTTLIVDSWIGLGRGNGTVGNVSTLTLYNSILRPGNFSAGYDNAIVGNSSTQAVTLNGTSLMYNNGTFNLAESSGSYSTLTLNDTAVWTNRGDVNFTGNGANRGAIVSINNNAVFGSNNRMEIGRGGATGVVTVANSARLHGNAWFSVGNGNAGNGTLIVKDSGSVFCTDLNITDTGTSIGTMTVQDNASVNGGVIFIGKAGGTVANATISGGTVNSRGNFVLGNSSTSQGTVNQSGGNVTISGELWLGQSGATGVWNQVSGSVISTNWIAIARQGSSTGRYTISGGSLAELDTADRFLVGSGGAGTLNISGTGFVWARGDMQLGENASGSGLLNLDGGTLAVRRVYRGAGPGTFNFNGGTLVASNVVNVDFFGGLTAANVLSGGANINTGTNTVNVNQALLDGTGGGGLTKTGPGTLRLNGINTYTGNTTVNAGTLGGTGALTGSLSVASGASLAPGVALGTFTVGGTVTLSAGSTNVMEINKNAATNDLVTGATAITYGGTLVIKNLGGVLAVNDTFKLFNASSYSGSFSAVVSQTFGQTVTWDLSNLTVNGTVRVASAVAAPVTLGSVVSGGTLNLTWPVDQIGWRLENQTNALTVGLNTNWFTVPNSTTTNSVIVPIAPGNPTVFYRLVYP